MNELPMPQVRRRPRVSLIWVVPVVAACVAGAMLWRGWRERGPEITIQFADGGGIRPRQTQLHYKGVVVGTVTDLRLNEDLGGVTVRLRLRREAAALARQRAEFWIVKPRVAFSGVSGLETLVAGVHLAMRPGEGAAAYSFIGAEEPPRVPGGADGRSFRLLTDQLGTMSVGAPVYYREFQVGEVEHIELAADAQVVEVMIRVRSSYTELVRGNTRFWNAGGVPVSFSLFGAEVQTASLRSFFTGAIALATPDTTADPAAEDAAFRLHREPEDEWLEWHPSIPIDIPLHSPAGESPQAEVRPALRSATAVQKRRRRQPARSKRGGESLSAVAGRRRPD